MSAFLKFKNKTFEVKNDAKSKLDPVFLNETSAMAVGKPKEGKIFEVVFSYENVNTIPLIFQEWFPCANDEEADDIPEEYTELTDFALIKRETYLLCVIHLKKKKFLKNMQEEFGADKVRYKPEIGSKYHKLSNYVPLMKPRPAAGDYFIAKSNSHAMSGDHIQCDTVLEAANFFLEKDLGKYIQQEKTAALSKSLAQTDLNDKRSYDQATTTKTSEELLTDMLRYGWDHDTCVKKIHENNLKETDLIFMVQLNSLKNQEAFQMMQAQMQNRMEKMMDDNLRLRMEQNKILEENLRFKHELSQPKYEIERQSNMPNRTVIKKPVKNNILTKTVLDDSLDLDGEDALDTADADVEGCEPKPVINNQQATTA